MNIKNIFFDFDGVITESVSAKTDAFEEMYLPYGKDIANKVVEYHKLHGGVSRYEKFKYFHKEFLNEVINKVKVDELAIQFSNIVLDKVINSDEVLGANYFIEKYHKKFQFWIITGTPNSFAASRSILSKPTPYFESTRNLPSFPAFMTFLVYSSSPHITPSYL